MGKNSGTTRSGGSSNPKGAGEPMNTYADFKNSKRLNILLNNIQKFVDQLDEAAKADDTTGDYIASLLDNGQEAIAEYVKAATAAARGLRQGRELAEEAIEDNEEDLRDKLYAKHEKAVAKAYMSRMRSIAEKIVNNKESDEEREISRNSGYTYDYSNGVVDIYLNGRRVAKGIRKNGKYDVKWF